MNYQIYAYDKTGTLNHAGTHEIKGEITIKKCRQLETAWRRWRRDHLKRYPGNYPLRQQGRKTVRYVVHPPVGNDFGRLTINL